MILPSLRPAYMASWTCFPQVTQITRQHLAGRVLVLPEALGRSEMEALVDILALLFDLRVDVLSTVKELDGREGKPAMLLLPVPLDTTPPPVPGSVVVALRRRQAGTWSLSLPHELLLLRDMLVECVGRQFSGQRLSRAAGWTSLVADTPGTALRFLEGVRQRLLREPRDNDASLYCAGLTATLTGMLRGVDPRLVQWAVALASGTPHPEMRVGTDAALLGRTEALRQAFQRGLVHLLEGAQVDLRLPLMALGRLAEAPGSPKLEMLIPYLDPQLDTPLLETVRRLGASTTRKLDLDVPLPPKAFIGHQELLQRLIALLAPSDTVTTVVLSGATGVGKTALAALATRALSSRMEPVWVDMVSGPEMGWIRVAAAMGVGVVSSDAADMIPDWVHRVHRVLLSGDYLVVVDNVEGMTEEDLPPWLPSGQGQCVVLVLSRTSQQPLQRARDALVLRVPAGLELREGRKLLALHAPDLRKEIQAGRADGVIQRVGGHPWALILIAKVLEEKGLDAIDLESPADLGEALSQYIQAAMGRLSDPERAVLLALVVCSPAGSPCELVLGVAGLGDQEVLSRLADQSLISLSKRTVELNELLRFPLEQNPEAKRELELRHALTTHRLMEQSRKKCDFTVQDDLYQDLLLATQRAIGFCEKAALTVNSKLDKVSKKRTASLCVNLADKLWKYPRGDRKGNLLRAIEAYEKALEIFTRKAFPRDWAMTLNNLGNALANLPTGDREKNLRRAIEAYEKALGVFTRKTFPRDWAMTQSNLGIALADLPTGVREENIQRAIEAYERALEVRTREALPQQWARTQNNLGVALYNLPTGDREENLQRAIEAYERALEVYTPEALPQYWARTQNNLGGALAQLPTGDKEENLHRAMEAYERALEVRTREAFPWDWAATQSNLGQALAQLPTGDREENLQRAIKAYEGALEVHTAEAFPRQHEETKANLRQAQAELEALKSRVGPAPPNENGGAGPTLR